jgi:CYTH domain-containing protein
VAIEIERKFLVRDDSWRRGATGQHIRQGYLCIFPDRAVRVRTLNDRAYVTIKGAKNTISRLEYEYEIPTRDATEMLDALCERPLIEKTRYHLTVYGRTWSVDEFEGENAGLVLAEVELDDERQDVQLPPWVDQEVTADPRYLNANLTRHPYARWGGS